MALDASKIKVRKSVWRNPEESGLVGSHAVNVARARKSEFRKSIFSAVSLPVPDSVQAPAEGSFAGDDSYQGVLREARMSVGHGGTEGAFPEEWDAQLLVDCGHTAQGDRLILFCPRFLAPFLDDPDELDRAFRFILLSLDGIVMHEQYIFVYCYLGMDWSDPRLAHRLRVAYDILPEPYAKNLKCLYILHPTSGFRVSAWTLWSWMSKRVWDKVQYVSNMDQLGRHCFPGDAAAQAELRRRFPQIVQRRDAELVGDEAPVTFGVPLTQICGRFGVDFTDKTTGRWYPRLPPALIFLCEALEREAADEDFADLFKADATAVYSAVKTVDEGKPLDRNLPTSALWCVLKLFLDCLPEPLLSFSMIDELKRRGIGEADVEGHRTILAEAFHKWLPKEEAYVTLYTASCLHTLCENAKEKDRSFVAKVRSMGSNEETEYSGPKLTPSIVAKVFGPSFCRSREATKEQQQWWPAARALVETLVREAESPEFWIGSPVEAPSKADDNDSGSDEGEDGGDTTPRK